MNHTTCQWEPNDGGAKCRVCGAWRTKPVRRVCRPGMMGRTSRSEGRVARKADVRSKKAEVKTSELLPSHIIHRTLLLAWRYLIAQLRERLVAKNEALPQRVIDQRLAICKECPQYDAQRHRCKLCGCCSGPSQKKWLNKLALASEECPDRPPRWGKYEKGLRR